MASSYNRKSDSSASRAQRRASAAGKRSSVSASTSRASVRKDAGRGQDGALGESGFTRRPRGSMDDAAIAAAASAAMSGGSVASGSTAESSNTGADRPSGATAATSKTSSAASSAARRQRSSARSTRVSSVRPAASEPAGSVRRERGATGHAASADRGAYGSSRAQRADGETRREKAEGRGSVKDTRSSRRSVTLGSATAGESTRRASRHADAAEEKPSEGSSRRSSRKGKDASGDIDGKKRKSIRGKAGKGSARGKAKDAAPAGTDDLSTSDSARRARNRDVDEVAAEGGRRVGDIRASRAAERAARARKRYLSYVLKLAAVVATVLVVVFGSIFIYRSNLLAITSVTVSGAEHLTDQEVTQLAAVPDDSTLLRLDTAGICARLEEHPWVQKAQISRQFPNSIKIQITERTPSAVVKISKKSIWVISTDGAWLSAATKDDWKSYRRIVDADATMSAPVAGSECTNEGVLNALKIYDGVSSKLAEQISSISAESAVKTSLTLKGGVTVAFGEATDLELKEADIFALLDKYSGTISYINVRVPDRPTYRSSKEQQ